MISDDRQKTGPEHSGNADPIHFGLTIGRRCVPKPIVAISRFMETYRIIPLGRAYRVEAVQPNGQKRVVRTWPTEEAAVSHLKALREIAERSGRPFSPAKGTGAADVEAARHDHRSLSSQTAHGRDEPPEITSAGAYGKSTSVILVLIGFRRLWIGR